MSNMIKVGLYGSRSNSDSLGRLAEEIYEYFKIHGSIEVTLLDVAVEIPNLDCIVYAARTDSQIVAAAHICQKQKIPLYVLSSDIDDAITEIRKICTVIPVANSSIEVNAFVDEVVVFRNNHRDWDVSIIEYHQSTKTDISNTALKLTDKMKLTTSIITSIRDDDRAQRQFQIPQEYISGYAIHQVYFIHPEKHTTRNFEIIIFGRKTYAEGLLHILHEYANTVST